MNLTEQLTAQAARRGDQPALVQRVKGVDRVESFGALAARVDRGAGRLLELGFRPSDRVLVFHPVSIELYGFLLACFKVGVVAVLADPSGGRGFLRQVCERARPKGFFGSPKAHVLRWSLREMRTIPTAMHPGGWLPGSRAVWGKSARDAAAPAATAADHPALITFTSGSTGRPKGVVRSHGFLLEQHRALEAVLELEAGQRDLVTLPVFALANLASGVTSVLADADLGRPAEVDPVRIAAQCEAWGVTRATAAPAFFEALLQGKRWPGFDKVFTGGGPVFHDLIVRLKDAGPGEVTAVYGSTEAEPVAELAAKDWTEDVVRVIAGGGGLPAGRPCCEVAVLEDRFGEPLPEMTLQEFDASRVERGEVVVAGPQVLTGYLDGEGDQETKIRVGGKVWHRTGDAGWLDRDGRLWLLGRCSAGMKGGALYPLAVEAALRMRFPEVRTAALELGKEAVLGAAGPVSPALEKQATGLGIDRVISVGALPVDRRHQSKIDYPALRTMLGKVR